MSGYRNGGGFAEIGQGVHITGDFEAAVNEGVQQGYIEGRMRCSVVRIRSVGGIPAIIRRPCCMSAWYPVIRFGSQLPPKGFGSENMSRIRMFTPSVRQEEIISFVADTVRMAGGNPCPPVVLGVGIGGDFELCAYLAKKALCRPVSNGTPIHIMRL